MGVGFLLKGEGRRTFGKGGWGKMMILILLLKNGTFFWLNEVKKRTCVKGMLIQSCLIFYIVMQVTVFVLSSLLF